MSGAPTALHASEIPTGGGSRRYPEWLRAAYRVQEFAGPGGPGAVVEGARSGLVTLPPGLRYPPHRHAAPEVYVIVGGRAAWEAGGERRTLDPVSFAYHPPWCPHAIESVGDEPLVVVYLWWGDAGVLGADAELVEGG